MDPLITEDTDLDDVLEITGLGTLEIEGEEGEGEEEEGEEEEEFVLPEWEGEEEEEWEGEEEIILEKESLINELEQLKKQQQSIENRIRESEKEIERVKNYFKTVESKHKEIVETLESRISEQNNIDNDVLEKITRIEKEIKELEKSYRGVMTETEIKKIAYEIEKLKSPVKNLAKSGTKARNLVKTLRTQLAEQNEAFIEVNIYNSNIILPKERIIEELRKELKINKKEQMALEEKIMKEKIPTPVYYKGFPHPAATAIKKQGRLVLIAINPLYSSHKLQLLIDAIDRPEVFSTYTEPKIRKIDVGVEDPDKIDDRLLSVQTLDQNGDHIQLINGMNVLHYDEMEIVAGDTNYFVSGFLTGDKFNSIKNLELSQKTMEKLQPLADDLQIRKIVNLAYRYYSQDKSQEFMEILDSPDLLKNEIDNTIILFEDPKDRITLESLEILQKYNALSNAELQDVLMKYKDWSPIIKKINENETVGLYDQTNTLTYLERGPRQVLYVVKSLFENLALIPYWGKEYSKIKKLTKNTLISPRLLAYVEKYKHHIFGTGDSGETLDYLTRLDIKVVVLGDLPQKISLVNLNFLDSQGYFSEEEKKELERIYIFK
jgi:hypothetical protein